MQQSNRSGGFGKLRLVGIGPGSPDYRTPALLKAISSSRVIVGYTRYLMLVEDLLCGKEVISSGMKGEIRRASDAIDRVMAGMDTAIISRGDSGVYGMAGLALELCRDRAIQPEVEIISGITAANAAASSLGAPLMCDYAVLSLSDLLVPRRLIRKRLEKVAEADLVTVLYNPKSTGRTRLIEEAKNIFLLHRTPDTPVGIAQKVSMEDERVLLTDLEHFTAYDIDMSTTVVIGNSQTVTYGTWMITPRGYPI
jgi:precorrin-3B C17-methyltransferase